MTRANKCIGELMEAIDSYIPEPARKKSTSRS